VFGRLAASLTGANRKRLAIEYPIDPERFERVRNAMLGYLSASFGAKRTLPEAEVLRLLEFERHRAANIRTDGVVCPKREQIAEFNLLHKSVAAVFGEMDIEQHVDVIDMPFNVRSIYGAVAPGRGQLPYSSTKLHSDVWAGVPVDAVVVVIPVLGDIENLTIACGEMAAEKELEAMRVMSAYEEGSRQYPWAVKYSDVQMKHGHVYMADARGLHQTIRKRRTGVRVSIDFRFRLNDPDYRALCPEVHGPDSMAEPVSFDQWLRVGSDTMLVFDETMAEAAATVDNANGAPFAADYRPVSLFPRAA
jgi:hypothetical protein